LQKVVVSDEGGNGGEEAGGGGDQGFGDAGSDGTKAGGSGSSESGEGINNAPNSAEEADEGSDTGGGGEPGHALFHAADFVGGSELHAHGDGLQRFEFLRSGIAGGGHLGLQFTIAGGVNVGEGRAGADESLRIRHTFGGPKDLEELIALTANAAEKAELLEDKRPGDQGKEQQDEEDTPRDPACLRKNVKDIADEQRG